MATTVDQSVVWHRSEPGSLTEEVSIVVPDDGKEYVCAGLDNRRFSLLVQVCLPADKDSSGELIGLYDLDGEKVDFIGTWEMARSSQVPGEVVGEVEANFSSGLATMTRVER